MHEKYLGDNNQFLNYLYLYSYLDNANNKQFSYLFNPWWTAQFGQLVYIQKALGTWIMAFFRFVKIIGIIISNILNEYWVIKRKMHWSIW